MTGSASFSWSTRRRFNAGKVVLTFLLLTVCAIPLAAMPRAQRHERRHEIDRLEELWRSAVLKNDTAALSSLLSDDYIAITPTGTVQTKDEALANLRSGRVRFSALNVTDRKVRFYGSAAIVTSTAEVQAAGADGGTASGSYRYTRVYALDPHGVWKIVSFEANRIVSGSEHR